MYQDHNARDLDTTIRTVALRTRRTLLQCLECDRTFTKVIGVRTYTVRCPRCGSTDVDVR